MKRIVTVSILLLLVLGCGSSGPPRGVLSGTITYKGQPVNGGSLILYSTTSDEPGFPIPVTQEGTFRTASLPPGEYKIVVQPFKGMPGGGRPTEGGSPEKAAERQQKMAALQGGPPTIPIPAKYEDKAQTDLKCTGTTGEQKITLELKD